MKIKCSDTILARKNLESAVKLGKQNTGLFGYIETINDNGDLYIHYRSGKSHFHAITDIRKIIFEENYIVLKYHKPIVNFLAECFILFVFIAGLLYVIGEVAFLQNVDNVLWALGALWSLWGIKIGPMFYIKNYINAIINNKAL